MSIKLKNLTLTTVLTRLQWLALALIPLLSPHAYTGYIWEAPTPENTNVWEGFRSVAIYLIDAPLIFIIINSLMLLFWSDDIRKNFFDTVKITTEKLGGFLWVALVVWSGLSILVAQEPLLALYNTAHLATELLMAFWIVYFVRNQGLLFAFVIAGMLHSGLPVAQLINGESLGLSELGEIQRNAFNPYGFGVQSFRGSGLAVHPNNLGGFLMIALFPALILLLSKNKWRIKILVFIMLGVTGVGLLATVSRGAIVGTAISVGLLVLFYALTQTRGHYRLALLVTPIILIPLLVAGIFIAGGSFADSLEDRLGGWIRNPESFTERLTYAFPDTTAVIRQSPAMGSGAGNLMIEIGDNRAGTQELLLPAHNVYWVIWSELGIIGMGFFIAANLYILFRLHAKNGNETFIWGLAFLAICLACIADFYFWGDLRSRTLILWVVGMWWGYALQNLNLKQEDVPVTSHNKEAQPSQ